MGPVVAIFIVVALSIAFYYQYDKRQRLVAERDADYEETMRALKSAGQSNLDPIYMEVAESAVRQYEIAKRKGDLMEICVQAGLVVAGYLQAERESEYRRWKDIQRSDCSRAGLTE